MINQAEVDRLYDCDVIDSHGERIGSVKQVWLDDRDGKPLWVSVHTGLFGTRESFVPIQGAKVGKGRITVPIDKQRVKDSPKIDVDDAHMSDAQQDELYRYYDLIPSASTGEHDRIAGTGGEPQARHAAGGRVADQRQVREQQLREQQERGRQGRDQGQAAGRMPEQQVRGREGLSRGDLEQQDRTRQEQSRHERDRTERAGTRRGAESVTRFEERLDVGTRRVETGRVRLVKHVVTEQQTVTVPVTHEEVRVVREPADGDTGEAFTEQEAEVTLHGEEPVVSKRVEPVEKVRLDKETVTEQREVGDQVRKERVDVERDDVTGDVSRKRGDVTGDLGRKRDDVTGDATRKRDRG
ncbi:DUF2382 domain-containing protein [Saccharothrix obliqua]|uniref:DUF2382 domain-containing protein n=1 Tax=Saccharothrix obliqua TaxID=2861747 RepID=UPI001C5F6BB8|nr:PRC and DUF2382 domain-containing protein [Saccharothrix obliqua]MBW4720071.1 DUF2382 domain-containing protein [Saccharothrix obliqua]